MCGVGHVGEASLQTCTHVNDLKIRVIFVVFDQLLSFLGIYTHREKSNNDVYLP